MRSLPKISKFIMELSRRRVIRAVGLYLVTMWLLAQGVADLFPAFGLPNWSVRAFVLCGFLGLPLVVFLAWRYELTPQGLIPDAGLGDNDETLLDYPHTGMVNVSWSDLKGTGQSATFHSNFVVGREPDSPVHIDDRRVSRRHAQFFPEQGGWWVEDLASSNGTFVDGARVRRQRLPQRCTVRLHAEGPALTLEILGTAEATGESLPG
jgi:hypothetical protein